MLASINISINMSLIWNHSFYWWHKINACPYLFTKYQHPHQMDDVHTLSHPSKVQTNQVGSTWMLKIINKTGAPPKFHLVILLLYQRQIRKATNGVPRSSLSWLISNQIFTYMTIENWLLIKFYFKTLIRGKKSL